MSNTRCTNNILFSLLMLSRFWNFLVVVFVFTYSRFCSIFICRCCLSEYLAVASCLSFLPSFAPLILFSYLFLNFLFVDLFCLPIISLFPRPFRLPPRSWQLDSLNYPKHIHLPATCNVTPTERNFKECGLFTERVCVSASWIVFEL